MTPTSTSPDSVDLPLGDYWEVIRRRWRSAALVWLGTMAIAAVTLIHQKPSYEAHGRLMLRVDRTATLLGFDSDKSNSPQNTSLTLQSSPLKTQTAVLTSASFVQKTIDALHLTDTKGRTLPAVDLLRRLKVKELPGADVLELQYQDSDPQRAATVVNHLMQDYLAYNIAFSRADAIAVRQFILEQLPKTEATVKQADAALRQFKERNGVVDLEAQTRGWVQNQLAIEDAMVKAQTELAASTVRLSTLQQTTGMDAQTALQSSVISQSAGVQQALKEYQQAQTDLQALRGKYLDNYPSLVNLQRKEQALRDLLKQRVQEIDATAAERPTQLQIGETEQKVLQDLISTDLDRRTLQGRLDQLRRALLTYQQQSVKLPQLEQGQRELQRRLEAAQSTYQRLLTKLQETQVVENQNTGSAEIIEPAIVPSSASTKKSFILIAGGIMGGLVLAVLAMIVLELQDQRLKSAREAKKLFDYKVLGSIPRDRVLAALAPNRPIALLPPSSEIALTNDPTRSAYHLLQANLRFNNPRPIKVILVTSSVRREGKSTVSANLAMTLAQLGHSVLLIDADLHAPTQHTIWHTESIPGLTDVLLSGTALPRVLRSLQPNLDLLPCGSLPVHPLALLDSDSMTRLIQTMANRYDHVILDSPPLLVDAEALTLGKVADGVLLVVRPDQVDISSAKATKALLDQSAQAVLGIVMNAIQPQIQPIPYP